MAHDGSTKAHQRSRHVGAVHRPLQLALLLSVAACPSDEIPSITTGSEGSSSTTTQPTATSSVTITSGMDSTGMGSTGMGSTGMDSTGMDSTGMDSTAGTGPICGDGIVNPGEDCDGDDLAGESCSSLYRMWRGTLACADDCTFDTSLCERFIDECGSHVISEGEICDGPNLGGQDCVSQGFDGGELGCALDCASFDTSGCFTCGDGVTNGMEICDGADLGGDSCLSQGFDGGVLGCALDCASFDTSGCFICGDGVTNGMETCDGADVAGLTCADAGLTGGAMGCALDCGDYDIAPCDPPTGWGSCINFGNAACTVDEVCVTDGAMSGGCIGQDCASPMDCPAAPATGNPTVECMDITAEGINDCILSCQLGEVCPDGMTCVAGVICLWPPL